MELYKEILVYALAQECIQITFPNLQVNAEQIVEGKCYQALKKIKAVLQDDRLDDVHCFMKIEEIVQILEEVGSSGGNRHDFG